MIVTRTLPGGRKINLEFVCGKDPALTKYYADKFGSQFLDELVARDPIDPQGWSELYARWADQMLTEAKVQEHYDFWTDDRGVRHPKYETQWEGRHQVIADIPQLLIPAVVKVI